MSHLPDDPDDSEPSRKPSLTQRIADGVRKGAGHLKAQVKAKVIAPVAEQLELSLARFKSEEKEIDFPIDIKHDTVWATQQKMADLFAVDRSVIARHIRNVFYNKKL